MHLSIIMKILGGLEIKYAAALRVMIATRELRTCCLGAAEFTMAGFLFAAETVSTFSPLRTTPPKSHNSPPKHPPPSESLRQMLARRNISRGSSQWLAQATSSQRRGAAALTNPFHYTVGEAAGIKVASRDDGGPTTNLAIVIRGGSRYESAPGVAHGLEKFAFKVCSECR